MPKHAYEATATCSKCGKRETRCAWEEETARMLLTMTHRGHSLVGTVTVETIPVRDWANARTSSVA